MQQKWVELAATLNKGKFRVKLNVQKTLGIIAICPEIAVTIVEPPDRVIAMLS